MAWVLECVDERDEENPTVTKQTWEHWEEPMQIAEIIRYLLPDTHWIRVVEVKEDD